jgi:peptidoglycan/xylan/chitin deacetylase (PgdA/CDA1 family)
MRSTSATDTLPINRMIAKQTKVPFQERHTRWRGLIDVASGCYPRFLFGGKTDNILPVFHFHEVQTKTLEPYLAYLAENNYRTVTSDAISEWVQRGTHPGPRTVALSFDDAWTSFWVIAAPLLERYDQQAILFVSPGRIGSEAALRPQTPHEDPQLDRRPPMFCSWPELRALHESGRVDIQAHGYLHAKVASDAHPTGFIAPTLAMHPHEIPLIDTPAGSRLAHRNDLGTPIFPTRSRLSDACRWTCPEATAACQRLVAQSGAAAFFSTPNWQERLMAAYRQAPPGRFETTAERDYAIAADLKQARAILEDQLNKPIRHLCFPWAVAGQAAIRLAADAGYHTAFSDRWRGYRAVRQGDPAHQLMRLKHQYIFCLPGHQRTWFLGKKPVQASGPIAQIQPPLPEEQS